MVVLVFCDTYRRRVSSTPPPARARTAGGGRMANAYSSATRRRTPPPAARSGRRLTLLGRLFTRVSVLLVSISHPLHLIRKAPPEGRQALHSYTIRLDY